MHTLTSNKGKYQSGQMGQTVNLLAYAFGGSNPSLPTQRHDIRMDIVPLSLLLRTWHLHTLLPVDTRRQKCGLKASLLLSARSFANKKKEAKTFTDITVYFHLFACRLNGPQPVG